MANDVRQALGRIVREYGPSVTEDARRCESLLRDLCPESHREVSILASAARERVPGELLSSAGTTPYPVVAARLRRRLEDNLSLTAASAAWAVATWAHVLGIEPSAEESCSAFRPSNSGQLAVALGSPTITEPSESPCSDSITVSQDGRGQYSSISAALARAIPGATILVSKGLYKEGLTINRPVQIIGTGRLGDIAIVSEYGSCLTMRADYATVRGMTLRNSQADTAADVPSVDVGAGKLVMEDCDISSASSGCVAIHGPGTDPIIRRCRIHDSAKHGVYVYDNGRGTIEQCDIWGNRVTGVRISKGGNPLVTGCNIHNTRSDGIAVCEYGTGTVEHCDIWANGRSGVRIWRGGDPTIKNCSIRDGRGTGVHVSDKGQGTLEQCDISANALSGIEVCEDGSPLVNGCKIHDNAKAMVPQRPFLVNVIRLITGDHAIDSGTDGGAYHHDFSSGSTIRKWDSRGDQRCGIVVSGGSNPTVQECAVYDNWGTGILVCERASGTFERCGVCGNKRCGIVVSSIGDLTVKNCTVHDNSGTGILVCERASGTFEQCETWGNSEYGAYVRSGCAAIFRQCTHHDTSRT